MLLAGYYRRFEELSRLFFQDAKNIDKMQRVVRFLEKMRESNSIIFAIGNGASAAIAEHTVADLIKSVGLRALTFSGTPLLTTLSNDYGYAEIFKKAIENLAKHGDILIAISSSGTSENILRASRIARKRDLKIITLTGFKVTNPLRQLGDINFWINSKIYGHIEILHGLILHWITDSVKRRRYT